MKGKDYIETINSIPFKMIFVKGGTVTIEYDKEKTAITVPDFHLAETPVTQELWRAVMGKDPERLGFKGHDKRPVEQVSWLDIVEGNTATKAPAFLQQLNESNQLKFKDYQLPSEAMWQFAAQGGNLSKGYPYSGSNHLKEVGWHGKNSHGETKPIKLKLPNELGFYDMSGNIWELCQDKWMSDVKRIPQNGLPNKLVDREDRYIDLRVLRGGSWYYLGYDYRIHFRNYIFSHFRDNDIGVRLSRY